MYREIIIKDEKGNIKRHTYEHLLTEKQWLKKQRQLRKKAVGEWIRWSNLAVRLCIFLKNKQR